MGFRSRTSTVLVSLVVTVLCASTDITAQSITPATLKNRKATSHSPLSASPMNFTVGQAYPPPPHCVATVSVMQGHVAVHFTGVTALSFDIAGLNLDPSSGCLFGNPTLPRTEVVPMVVTLDSGSQSSVSVPIIVAPIAGALYVASAQLPPHPTGEVYAERLQALGGSGFNTWTAVSGSLPSGLQLQPNGYITGTPTGSTSVSSTIDVKVVDANPPYGTATGSVLVQIDAAPDCSNPKYSSNSYFNGFVPLSKSRNTNPDGLPTKHLPTQNDVICFYGSTGITSTLSQVQYLYGFGEGTNTISADLVSFQTPAPVGIQIAVGTSVTGGGSATQSSSQTSAPNQQTSPSGAIASLEAGGNLYLHLIYPLAVYSGHSLTVLAAVNSKLGFSFNGFAGQSTLSQGTEQYFSLPAEVFASYNGILNKGGFYGDYQGGLETVPGSFKTAANLPSNAFLLQQVSFGISFAGLFRVGAQRYFGPEAGFNASGTANFGTWHFVIQLSPSGS